MNKRLPSGRITLPRQAKTLGMVLVLVLTFTLGGCFSQKSPAPQPAPPQPQGPAMMGVAVYYPKNTVDNMYLVREIHKVEKSESIAQVALNELISGSPLTDGAYRVLPPETRILGINIDKGLATVDFSAEVLNANVGASGEALGIASIVNTLTEFPTIERVQFTVDGSAQKGIDWWGHVGLHDQPFIRDIASVYEPSIWVTAPVDGQSITSPVRINGNARVFEATVNFRLKDADGKILGQGYTTSAMGAPERGDFSAELAFNPGQSGPGSLEVFETSMKDGGDLHKITIPVVLP